MQPVEMQFGEMQLSLVIDNKIIFHFDICINKTSILYVLFIYVNNI